MKNSSYYIAPVGDRTHDLPHTVASNMVKMSHALNHSATEAVSLEWPRDRWTINLSALLHGIALDVYNRQPVNETSNFDSLKEALLQRFILTEEGFREKLRTAKPERGESFGQFMT